MITVTLVQIFCLESIDEKVQGLYTVDLQWIKTHYMHYDILDSDNSLSAISCSGSHIENFANHLKLTKPWQRIWHYKEGALWIAMVLYSSSL